MDNLSRNDAPKYSQTRPGFLNIWLSSRDLSNWWRHVICVMWRKAGLTDVGLCKFIFFGIYIIVILKLTKSIHNFIIIDVSVSSIVVTLVVIIVIKAIWNLSVIIIEGIKNKIDIIVLIIVF